MDSAVFSCQWFSSVHGFKTVFSEDWAERFSVRCFCSPWCTLSQQQQQHSLCKSGWRERIYCDVLTGVGLWGEKKKEKEKTFCSALHTSKMVLEVCRLIVQLFCCCFGLFSDLVLCSYLSVCFQLSFQVSVLSGHLGKLNKRKFVTFS